MKKSIKIIALALCAVLILGLALSESYIFINSGHDCIGEGCSVCQRLHIAEAIVNHLIADVAIMLVICLGLEVACAAALVICRTPVFSTPVKKRVKLNN